MKRKTPMKRIVFVNKAGRRLHDTQVEGHVIEKLKTEERRRIVSGGSENTRHLYRFVCTCGWETTGVWSEEVMPHLVDIGAEHPELEKQA